MYLCICMLTLKYEHVHVHFVCTYIIRTYLHWCVLWSVHTYIRTYVSTSANEHTLMSLCLRTYVRTYVHGYQHTCIYVRIQYILTYVHFALLIFTILHTPLELMVSLFTMNVCIRISPYDFRKLGSWRRSLNWRRTAGRRTTLSSPSRSSRNDERLFSRGSTRRWWTWGR